jgi:hypothetical protein
MQKLFLISLLFTQISIIKAQENKQTRNGINYEFFGTSYSEISLNYERFLILNQKFDLIFGGGIGFSSYISTPKSIQLGIFQLIVPIQINLLIGSGRHKIEVGYGMPIVIREDFPKKSTFIYVLKFGYRFQPRNSNLYLRASINPSVIVYTPKLIGGIGIGYNF